MLNFVLVHGGAHAGWCWDHVVPHLMRASEVENVIALDLTGHGGRLDSKPHGEVTAADYVNDIVYEIESRDLSRVVLVGHSLAGLSLAPAAARLRHRLEHVICLSTSNPPVGRSVLDLMKHPLSPISRAADAETMFCNDLDDQTSSWLLSRLGPEPAGPMQEAVTIATLPSDVPSTYILLERDEALPPDYQREQAQNAGIQRIVPFDAGHSAFASRPKALARTLLEISGS